MIAIPPLESIAKEENKNHLHEIDFFDFDGVKVEYDIQAIRFRLPALSLQPLVENAVHKGLRKKNGGGKILIKTEEFEQYFQIIIDDDGVGFKPEILEQEGHVGIRNVKERLGAMCGGNLSVESKIGQGSVFTVRIRRNSI